MTNTGPYSWVKSIIAADSVATKSILDNKIWGGNPAKFIRKIKER
jgi:acetyltransferase-like isoleucine patch superfamily enzyme